jgi:type IV pilus assembly protein PilF
MMKARLRMLGVATAVLLAGCQQQGLKGEGSTGQLGEVQGQQQSQVNELANVYVELAAEYLRQGQLAPALQNARKGVMVAPKNPGAQNMLGLVHQQLGETELAERHFREAVSLDPQDPYANNAFGQFLCAQERYDEAQRYFDAALANPLNPEPWVPLANAGVCAYEQGKLDEAESYLRKALRANPRLAPALVRMAEISYSKGNYLSARAYLQRYLEVAPHTAETLWLGIRTERQLGDMDQVASYELMLRSKFPDSEPLRYLEESR